MYDELEGYLVPSQPLTVQVSSEALRENEIQGGNDGWVMNNDGSWSWKFLMYVQVAKHQNVEGPNFLGNVMQADPRNIESGQSPEVLLESHN